MFSSRITIVDYGAGNTRSMEGALSTVGLNSTVESDVNRIRRSRALILPGVGSFRSAMATLNKSGIADALREAVLAGSNVLGVCLGMQLMADWSDEDDGVQGLSIVRGVSRRFNHSMTTSLRVPHMGFNSVRASANSILFGGVPENGDFYFAHSYRMEAEERSKGHATALTDYGGIFISAYEMDESVFGVQFHPELSQGNGLQMLRNFARHASC